MVQQVAFWILAVLIGAASLLVVSVRNVVHAALGLVGALLGVAGLFILFGAEFVGLIQVLLYVGAVVILFLFGIMLTSARAGEETIDNDQRPLAAIVAVGVFGVLAAGILMAFGDQRLELDVAFPITGIGTEIFTRWFLGFQALALLLLAALIGAIVLAKKD